MSGGPLTFEQSVVPEISCRAAINIALYFERIYGTARLEAAWPRIAPPQLLSYVRDPAKWVSLAFGERLVDVLAEESGDPAFARKCGLYTATPECLGFTYQLLRALATPAALYPKVVTLGPTYNKVGTFKVEELAKDSVRIRYTSRRIEGTPLACEVRKGQLAGFPTIWGMPAARIVETQCLHTGADSCVYELAWRPVANPVPATLGAVVLGGVAGALASASALVGAVVGGALGGAGMLAAQYRRDSRSKDALLDEQTEGLSTSMFDLARQVEEIGTLNTRLRAVLDSSLDAVIVCDAHGVILEWGRPAEATFGWTAAEACGRALPELLFPADARATVTELLKGGGSRGRIETNGLRRGERPLPLEIAIAPLPLGNRAELAVFLRDLTERRELEASLVQRDRLASIGNLAAGVAHELNGPLSYVLANLELVAHTLARPAGDPSPKAERLTAFVDDALHGVRRAIDIVSDLRGFSRDSTGDAPVPVDANRVVDAALQLVSMQQRHRARIVVTHAPVPAVLANEARLSQVVLNLVMNALQAFPPGEAGTNEVRVTVGRVADERVRIEVADNGPGIAPQVLDRLFLPFTTTKPVGDGTGLGLFVSRRIVATYGGELQVRSAPGEGATFTVLLPRSAAALPEKVPTAVEDAVAVATEPPLSVLLVDDDPAVLRAMSRRLAFHRVTTAEGGTAALGLLGAQRFDLVLCDVMMPPPAGPEVFREAVERHHLDPETFWFLTGGAFGPDAIESLAPHRDRCLLKPLPVAALNEVVRTAASRRRASTG